MDNNKFLSGEKLYGDDFSIKEIKKWYEDEKEGYSKLTYDYEDSYGYSQINILHGFSKLNHVKKFEKALSLGGATGEELFPIINKINHVYIIEPSKKLRAYSLKNKPIHYLTPQINGKMKFKDNEFDLNMRLLKGSNFPAQEGLRASALLIRLA